MENTVWLLLNELSLKKGITEIIINSHELVYIERDAELVRLNTSIKKEDITSFCHEVAQMNQCTFNDDFPIIDGLLPDGSRINILFPTYTQTGPAITIRKYLENITTFDELDGKFNISKKWVTFFKALVRGKFNIIVSGGTGVGKTTFLNLMLQEISPTQRVITIEDTRELRFNNLNTVRMLMPKASLQVKKPLGMRELVKNTLRMRPDRIVIGEVRGAEAFDFLQVMNTGHDGSMCSVHANTPSDALMRLENLVLFSGFDIPVRAIRYQIMSAVDFIIHLERDRTNGRIVSKVTEVCKMEGDKILLQDIGALKICIDDSEALKLEFTGLVPMRVQKLMDAEIETKFFIN